jgi:hypothetical protein
MTENIFKSKTGIVIISIIWGLGLSALFRKSCEGRNCKIIKYVGPNPNEVSNSYYNYGGTQCYNYQPIMTKCH